MAQVSPACPVCTGRHSEIFVHIPRVPVLCNILWPQRQQALAVNRVDIELAFCPDCGHIFNPDFDPALMDYSQAYENSLHFSPRFQQYAEDLARDLVERHQLQNRDIIEIGSGKGDFLELLCELGDNRGVGFDPSYIPGENARTKSSQITFVQDFYAEEYATTAVDFVCCRHTLEHIPDPRALMRSIRRTLGDRSDIRLFFEVPNAGFTLKNEAIWDIIYEHCGYFTRTSLAYLFADAGFEVHRVEETFDGQFLTVEATPSATHYTPETWGDPLDLLPLVQRFSDAYRAKVREEQALLARMAAAAQTAVIWGAGSKGITFLNVLDPGDQIGYAVDINPRKQGMHITGTGQSIIAPERLQEIQPDVVFIMNPNYIEEIGRMLRDLNVHAQLLTV